MVRAPSTLRERANSGADARECPAAADIRNRRAEFRVTGCGIGAQKRGHGHDHAGLAIAALRDLMVYPGLLNRREAAGTDSFDGNDLGTLDRACRNHAAPGRRPVDMNRAGPALGNTAAELRAGQTDLVANDPQKWRIRLHIQLMANAVYSKRDRHNCPQLPNLDCPIVTP